MARYAPSLLVLSGLAELGRKYEASAKIETRPQNAKDDYATDGLHKTFQRVG